MAAPRDTYDASRRVLHVWLPRKFWEDHVLRADFHPGDVQAQQQRRVYVALDREQFLDLLSDAQHYAVTGSGADGFADYGDVVASAERTLARLRPWMASAR